ncbi:MAG: FAD binding domain-containing protein [Gemmatimonadota bacterium]
MKPAPFDYVRPASVEEAIALLGGGGDGAKVLAGGQSLIPTMNFRLAQPSLLVDLADLDELTGIRSSGDGGLWIGAMTRQRTVERSPLVREAAPLLADVMPWVAHPQIRNRGTIGGSLAHADPAAELPAVVAALEAAMVVRGPDGTRCVPAREFYLGLFTTALEPGELLVAVEVPPPGDGTRFAFEEVARRHGDFALAGVAVALTRDGGGTVSDAAVSLLGVDEVPVLSTAASELIGRRPDPETVAAVADATAAALEPPGDIHATPDYRRHLAGVLTRRALERACA